MGTGLTVAMIREAKRILNSHEEWRELMLCKLMECGCTERQAEWLLDSGIPWTL